MNEALVAPLLAGDIDRDWLDYLGAFSGLIGALLAALAIAYSFRQSAAAKRDLARERRLEFELGLLAEVRRQIEVTRFQHLSGYVGALIRDAADETDLPTLRAVIGTKAGTEGYRLKQEIVGDDAEGSAEAQARLLATVRREIDDAIDRRFGEDL